MTRHAEAWANFATGLVAGAISGFITAVAFIPHLLPSDVQALDPTDPPHIGMIFVPTGTLTICSDTANITLADTVGGYISHIHIACGPLAHAAILRELNQDRRL